MDIKKFRPIACGLIKMMMLRWFLRTKPLHQYLSTYMEILTQYQWIPLLPQIFPDVAPEFGCEIKAGQSADAGKLIVEFANNEAIIHIKE